MAKFLGTMFSNGSIVSAADDMSVGHWLNNKQSAQKDLCQWHLILCNSNTDYDGI